MSAETPIPLPIVIGCGSMTAQRDASGNVHVWTQHDRYGTCDLIRSRQVVIDRADVRDLIDVLTRIEALP